VRNKTLINEETDPNIDLLDLEYCMLEKIGRSRDQGEITQGRMSLVNDNKKVYHHRKVLTQHFLIVHQNFCLKSLALQQNISGGLVHLSRFYNKRKTKHIVIMERIANLLRTKPNYQVELSEFRKIFGRNVSIIKLVKTADFRKFFKICVINYRLCCCCFFHSVYFCRLFRTESCTQMLASTSICIKINKKKNKSKFYACWIRVQT
jgi:hypothetical protein